MKIKYQFVNETVEIEVADDWGNILVDLDRREYNNNHTETRRHYSLDAIEYEGEEYGYQDSDLMTLFEEPSMADRLPDAIKKLQPQQQTLVRKVFYEGIRPGQIAAEEGVSNAAISRRLNKIYTALKKILETGG